MGKGARWGMVLLVLAVFAGACSSDSDSGESAETDRASEAAAPGGTGNDGGAASTQEEAIEEEAEATAEEEPADAVALDNASAGAATGGSTSGTRPSATAATAAAPAPFGEAAPAAVPEPLPVPPDEGPVATPTPTPPVSGFTTTSDDALSTFALDIDTGSYTYARNSLRNGQVPQPSAVRVEEFVNAIDQRYPQPADGAVFEVFADGTTWPYAQVPGNQLVRIGLSTPEVVGERLPASLTFVVDTSGSMADFGRLDLVRDALRLLVANLEADDVVAIVAYSENARVVIGATPASDQAALVDAIASLQPDQSTNLAAGMDLGYQLARQNLRPSAINRVILLSDGIANTGATDAETILSQVREDAAAGIDLVTVGVGLTDFNDALMERLADEGDGFYRYIDTIEEAERLFSVELTRTLQTIAREARIQVEFNPAVVQGYRLIGFENRAIADEDFTNDARDAGEIGAGHQVTALYEVVPTGAAGPLAQVRLRWLSPETGEPQELARNIDVSAIAGTYEQSEPLLQLDAVVAAWAELMRNSGFAAASDDVLAQDAQRLAALIETEQAAEIAELLSTYATLT